MVVVLFFVFVYIIIGFVFYEVGQSVREPTDLG